MNNEELQTSASSLVYNDHQIPLKGGSDDDDNEAMSTPVSRRGSLRSRSSRSPEASQRTPRRMSRRLSNERKKSVNVWRHGEMNTFRMSKRSVFSLDSDDDDEFAGTTSGDESFNFLTQAPEVVGGQNFHESTATNLTMMPEEEDGSDPLKPLEEISVERISETDAPEGGDGASRRLSIETRRTQVRQQQVRQRNGTKLLQFRRTCGSFVNNEWFQFFMTFLIMVNAIILGALTFDGIQNDATALKVLEGLDLAILVVFTLEVVLHFIYLGPLELIQHSWLVFDTLVVAISWAFLGSSLSVLRSLRIFRVVTLVSRWDSLRTLFEAVGSTIPKMASIWMALLILYYIFAVLFTTLFHGLYEDGYLGDDYFGRLDKTFVTLFQVMTLDNWSEVAREVMVYEPWAFLPFFIFILFTSFFVINLVVAVICESLIHVKDAERDNASSYRREPALASVQLSSTRTSMRNVNKSGSCCCCDRSQAAPSAASDEQMRLLRELISTQRAMQSQIQDLTEEVKRIKAEQVEHDA